MMLYAKLSRSSGSLEPRYPLNSRTKGKTGSPGGARYPMNAVGSLVETLAGFVDGLGSALHLRAERSFENIADDWAGMTVRPGKTRPDHSGPRQSSPSDGSHPAQA